MEHLITWLSKTGGTLDKNVWEFTLPNGVTKSFAQLEDEAWELAGVSERHWIWKRRKIG